MIMTQYYVFEFFSMGTMILYASHGQVSQIYYKYLVGSVLGKSYIIYYGNK